MDPIRPFSLAGVVVPAFTDKSRPVILRIGLFIAFLASLLWLLDAVADWVFAVLKASH
jgi:hypothetical protein